MAMMLSTNIIRQIHRDRKNILRLQREFVFTIDSYKAYVCIVIHAGSVVGQKYYYFLLLVPWVYTLKCSVGG